MKTSNGLCIFLIILSIIIATDAVNRARGARKNGVKTGFGEHAKMVCPPNTVLTVTHKVDARVEMMCMPTMICDEPGTCVRTGPASKCKGKGSYIHWAKETNGPVGGHVKARCCKYIIPRPQDVEEQCIFHVIKEGKANGKNNMSRDKTSTNKNNPTNGNPNNKDGGRGKPNSGKDGKGPIPKRLDIYITKHPHPVMAETYQVKKVKRGRNHYTIKMCKLTCKRTTTTTTTTTMTPETDRSRGLKDDKRQRDDENGRKSHKDQRKDKMAETKESRAKTEIIRRTSSRTSVRESSRKATSQKSSRKSVRKEKTRKTGRKSSRKSSRKHGKKKTHRKSSKKEHRQRNSEAIARQREAEATGSTSCFSAFDTVSTPHGPKTMSALQEGDEILSFNSHTNLYSMLPVHWFIHRDPEKVAEFVTLTTSTGRNVSLTADHLIPVASCEKPPPMGAPKYQRWERDHTIEAKHANPGQCLMVYKDEKSTLEPIIDVRWDRKKGIFSPLTKEGNIIANGIHVSCFSACGSVNIQRSIYRILQTVREWSNLFYLGSANINTMTTNTDPPIIGRILIHAFKAIYPT